MRLSSRTDQFLIEEKRNQRILAFESRSLGNMRWEKGVIRFQIVRSLEALMISFVAALVGQRISLLSDQSIHQTLKLKMENLTVFRGIRQKEERNWQGIR